MLIDAKTVGKEEFLDIKTFYNKDGEVIDSLLRVAKIVDSETIRFDLLVKDGLRLVGVLNILPFEVGDFERVKTGFKNVLYNLKRNLDDEDDNFGAGLNWSFGDGVYGGFVLRPKIKEATVVFPTQNVQLDGSYTAIVYCDYDQFILSFKSLFGLWDCSC